MVIVCVAETATLPRYSICSLADKVGPRKWSNEMCVEMICHFWAAAWKAMQVWFSISPFPAMASEEGVCPSRAATGRLSLCRAVSLSDRVELSLSLTHVEDGP